ncbi:SRPBCC family protein [Streptomyces sp. NRRL WC-3549]|uniref:SRPBCC family protein n=1 Tax=Streptomyces sp. NRRL WC-3549 TaxID=1463925 RepID=UPI0004C7C592|nr:SRPBCC family protein [Streptomyces sp. NRRL WC-3549]
MARTDKDESGAAESGMDRLRGEASNFLSAQVEKIAEKAGGKLTDLTGQLTDVAENGGQLPAIASRLLKGESPAKAFISEKAKGVKDSVMGKAKGAFGGGGGEEGGGGNESGGESRKPGSPKVTSIIEVLDVGVPLRDAYDYWTQYDKFNDFAKGVQNVSKSDEMESDWKVKIAFSSRSFKATVQEQIPDDRIVWTSEGAKGSTKGVVSFHELAPSLTRIVLVVEYYPSGFFEKTGNLWRAQGRRMRLDFKHFQRFVTLTEDEPEGWRGEIRDGEVVVTHEEAVEREEAEDSEGSEEDEQPEEDEDDYEGDEEEPEEEDEEGDEEDEEEPEEEDEEGDEGYEDEDEDEEEPDDEEEEDDEDDEDDDEGQEEEDEDPEPRSRRRRRRS